MSLIDIHKKLKELSINTPQGRAIPFDALKTELSIEDVDLLHRLKKLKELEFIEFDENTLQINLTNSGNALNF